MMLQLRALPTPSPSLDKSAKTVRALLPRQSPAQDGVAESPALNETTRLDSNSPDTPQQTLPQVTQLATTSSSSTDNASTSSIPPTTKAFGGRTEVGPETYAHHHRVNIAVPLAVMAAVAILGILSHLIFRRHRSKDKLRSTVVPIFKSQTNHSSSTTLRNYRPGLEPDQQVEQNMAGIDRNMSFDQPQADKEPNLEVRRDAARYTLSPYEQPNIIPSGEEHYWNHSRQPRKDQVTLHSSQRPSPTLVEPQRLPDTIPYDGLHQSYQPVWPNVHGDRVPASRLAYMPSTNYVNHYPLQPTQDQGAMNHDNPHSLERPSTTYMAN